MTHRRSASNTSTDVRVEVEQPTKPFNFANYETLFTKISSKKSSDKNLQSLFNCPDKDVQITTHKKEHRTLKSNVPEQLKEAKENQYITDSTQYFLQDYKVISKRYGQYTNNGGGSNDNNNNDFPSQVYEIDIEQEEEAATDDFNINLLKPEENKTKQLLKNLSKKDRLELFSLYGGSENSNTILDHRRQGTPIKEERGLEFCVEVKELTFEIGVIEPLFGILAVYDIKKKLKLSENFYFDINSEQSVDMLGVNKGKRDAITLSNKAIFSLKYSSPDIYIVLIITKTLSGDEDAATDPYFKLNSLKPKERSKVESDVKEACNRMGSFRQMLAWDALQVFEEKGNGSLKLIDGVIEFKHLAKVKNDIYSYIQEMEKDKQKQKMKVFPGKCIINVSKTEKEVPYRLDPALNLVTPFPNPDTLDKDKIIREIRELKVSEDNFTSNVSYINELYFYPETLNFSNYSGSVSCRNIELDVKLMDNDNNVQAEGLPVIYGKSTSKGGSISTEESTIVEYHNKKPKFYDEIKIILPPILTNAHHLLITFTHVHCQLKKGKNEKLETTLGYSCIPLLEDDKVIKDETRSVPVGYVFPPGYRDPKSIDIIKWVDNKKSIFSFRTKLVSTLFTQDDPLNAFFSSYNISEESNLLQIIKDLPKSQLHALVQFFPIIMKQLIRVMCNASPGIADEAFLTMLSILDMVYQCTYQSSLLESYITYIFTDKKGILFESLARIMVNIIKTTRSAKVSIYKYLWFLFGIMYKSMVFKLHKEGLLEDKTSHRSGRFSETFTSNLQALTELIIRDVLEMSRSSYTLAKFTNLNLALFFKDCISVMDRGILFELIYNYVSSLDPTSSIGVLADFKFAFIKVIIDHEHYLPLNLPSNLSDSIDSPAKIKSDFWESHFLSGLLLNEIEATLIPHEIDNTLQSDPEIRLKAIETLKFILRKHAFDSRYKDSSDSQKYISGIYFPYILIVIDNIDTINAAPVYEKRIWLLCFLIILKGVKRKLLCDWWKKETLNRVLNLFEVLRTSLDMFEYEGKKKMAENPLEFLMDDSDWSDTDSNTSSDPSSSGATFNDKVKKNKKKIGAQGMAKKSPVLSSNSKNLDTKEFIESFYHRNTPTQEKHKKSEFRAWVNVSNGNVTPTSTPTIPHSGSLTGLKDTLRGPNMRDSKKEQNLFKEISLIILDSVVQFSKDFRHELTSKNSVFFSKVFGIITHLMRKNQSTLFLTILIQVLSTMIVDFKRPLFRLRNSICGELTFEILKYCNSKISQIRTDACSILYLLISCNYKEMKHFSRMKLQCTIGISKLVGITNSNNQFKYLCNSLSIVAKRSKERHPKEGSLGTQVEEMVNRLFGVIKDSIQMNEMRWDPERTIELFYKISIGYIDSPDLRVTWLENLASYHDQNNNLEESAQTKILTAALVAAYLNVLNRFPLNITDQFESVFPHTKDLIVPSSDSLLALENEICQSSTFTVDGYINLLIDAIETLRKASLYESCISVYQLILPILRKKKDYKKQAQCYADLHKLCDTVVSENLTNQRLYANYYRVAFYGKKFGELCDTEWVYKESSAIRLADFSDRLKSQFASIYGTDKVSILPNTKTVIASELNPDNLYLQIISLDIYLTEEELQERSSLFEQNNKINRFIFETPFTKSGKVHGDMAEQYKKKIVLQVEDVFPYVKKRLRVISKTESIVTPIETAIELIERKTLSLKNELATATPNIKTLQMGLQGSLLLQVNAGPLEICRVFLGDNMVKYDRSNVEKLQSIMNEFILTLENALAVHQVLIKPEQLILQKELEIGLKSMQTEALKYMSLMKDEEDDQEENSTVEDVDDV